MLLPALALTVGLSAPGVTADPMVRSIREGAGVVVYLGCQVSNASLTDCKVVNDEPVDAATASEALRLSQTMTLPAALTARNAGHIVVKLTVKR